MWIKLNKYTKFSWLEIVGTNSFELRSEPHCFQNLNVIKLDQEFSVELLSTHHHADLSFSRFFVGRWKRGLIFNSIKNGLRGSG